MSLSYLCHMIVERQKLNRLRLTTNAMMSRIRRDNSYGQRYHNEKRRCLYLFHKIYDELKVEMSRVSKLITATRKQLGAKCDWGSACDIRCVRTMDKRALWATDIERIAEDHLINEIILETGQKVKTKLADFEAEYNEALRELREIRRVISQQGPTNSTIQASNGGVVDTSGR